MTWFAGALAALPVLGDYFGKQEDQDFSNQTREHQENFQREMSNTQWQRGVTDMKAAGLNPMLAYSQGGASSPSGSSGGGPSGSSMGSSVSQGLSSAMAYQVQKAQIENIRTDTTKKEAEREEVIARTPTFATQIRQGEATAAQIEQAIRFLKTVNPWRIDRENTQMIRDRYAEGEDEARFPHRYRRAGAEVRRDEAVARQHEAEVRKIHAAASLLELDEPGARARAASDETWYGQNIRPYGKEIGAVAGSAAGAAFGLKGIGALRTIQRGLSARKGIGLRAPRRGISRAEEFKEDRKLRDWEAMQ